MSVLSKRTADMELKRDGMRLDGIEENKTIKHTAHNALQLTLGTMPQGGGFTSAKPTLKKAKVIKTMVTKAPKLKNELSP